MTNESAVDPGILEAAKQAVEILERQGLADDHAEAVAETIVAGERNGCTSHGWPRHEGPPFVFDPATSDVARGDLELHGRAGKPVPDDWGIDAGGLPTTDAQVVLNGAMRTFGGHKGSALAAMVELIAGPMIGEGARLPSERRYMAPKVSPSQGLRIPATLDEELRRLAAAPLATAD